MSQDTESLLLNGAYTSLPNPENQARTTRRRRFRKALKVAAHVTTALCLALLVVWFVFRPKPIKVYVSRARLIQFNLTETNSLNYKLSLDLVFRNPNNRGHIKFKRLLASTYYHGSQFGWAPIHGFQLGGRGYITLPAVFEGKTELTTTMTAGGFEAERFVWDAMQGVFDVDVRVYGWLKHKVGCFGSRYHTVRIKCELQRVALGADESLDGGFRGTRCKFHV